MSLHLPQTHPLINWLHGNQTSPGNQPGKIPRSKTPKWMLMTTSVIDDWPMSYGFPDGLLIRTPTLEERSWKNKSLHPFQKIKRFSQTWKTQPFFNDDASHHSLPPDICLELSTHSRGRNMRPLSVTTQL